MFGSTYIQSTKFARSHKAQSGNVCDVDHQEFSYVKALSETHLYHVSETLVSISVGSWLKDC